MKRSAFSVTSVLILAAVLVVAALAASLLARTVSVAQRISSKAAMIAQSGRGINIATDSVIQLQRTNDTAASILRSASPLQGKLTAIVGSAGAINSVAGLIDLNAATIDSTAQNISSSAGAICSTAGAINTTAGKINTTAGAIGSTAGGINTAADAIVPVAQLIDRDAKLINVFLDQSISIAHGIKGDTGNIIIQAVFAHDHAACIDRKVVGMSGQDGDCQGRGG